MPKTAFSSSSIFLLPFFLLQILNNNEEVVHGRKVSAIIVFGDSSVDSGNNNHISTVLRSNFPPYGQDFDGRRPTGRFSNGRIVTDFISEAFGIKRTIPAYLDPTYNITHFATGVCFASAGTGYDNATSDIFSVIPLWKELQYYKEYQNKLRDHLGPSKGNQTIAQSLHLISLGTNDFLENYFLLPRWSVQFSVEEYENFLAGAAGMFVRELHGLGARKMSIGGLPPMGCLPLERSSRVVFGGGCVEKYNRVARDFNGKLMELVEKMEKELRGIQIVFSNPFDILSDMIDHPSKFGFSNSARACCGTGRFEMGFLCSKINPFTCSDANKYVFWDAFHPTQKANSIMAKHIVQNYLSIFL
ncbi:GDSL esterase/lipase At4g26790-like [Momordica charantia]|uniref:GDSL esterase/lipase At4g26790-like n=1 Tax=Momordica charantia TaxID=3673 RepID=A0A6J1CEG8_MOMCH|nr:GDSL esterase/lipase At4g26790-like [Momordica charantia]